MAEESTVATQCLSTHGSDRATAYNMSNKIVRYGDDLLVIWLEAPLAPGGAARVVLGICDGRTGTLRRAILVGEGIDNHCGAALALDADGHVHAVTGAHHGPFLYRWSDRPGDPDGWSDPLTLGLADTYPSLVVDGEGTLHLAHRERGERWQLWYRRKRKGGVWEAPIALAVSPTPGYNHFMQSIAVGPGGTLHLTFQYHYADSGRAEDCEGRMAGYLRSEDGGGTWFNEGRRCDDLPLTVDSLRPICRYPDGGVRIGNHVVDGSDQPWLFSSLPDTPGGALWHRTDAGWERQDMAAGWPNLNFEGGRATSLSRDDGGRLHLVVATAPGGRATRWFDPSLELHHLAMDAAGVPVSLTQLTEGDPSVARWLPALEQWDWTRAGSCCADGLWMAYTSGLNAGGIWGNNRNVLETEVYLSKLQEKV